MFAILGITCTLQLLMLLCILGKYIGPNYVPDFRLFKIWGGENDVNDQPVYIRGIHNTDHELRCSFCSTSACTPSPSLYRYLSRRGS